jgi:hypothetical protein
MSRYPDSEKKKLTLRLSEDSIACAKQRADELGLSVSALVEQFFDAIQAPAEARSADFQALLDLVDKIPPQSEAAFDPEDPYYKKARDQRHEFRGR